ncbi:type III polyketide synthase [Aquiflexum sp.]|uniref:type III polyketide synthase n=1 Tax=Aquiflexum sp. TaxID=1872584 RepID=UPI0035934CDB
MNNHIVSIGTANPGKPILQAQIGEFMKMAHGLDSQEARKLNFIYRHTGIENRYSVIDDFRYEDPEKFNFFPSNATLEPFPSTKKRMGLFEKSGLGLAKAAILDCMQKTKHQTSDITHLILVSCTGMFAPGLELEIMHSMDFQKDIERYAIHFMGCYAAFNGIKLADRICDSDPKAKVLILSVELCTIHFQKNYNEDNLLANALFGDGAAAALVMRDEEGLAIKKFHSRVFKEGEKDMAWSIGDFGFEMRLSKYVPELLSKGLFEINDYLEEKFQLSKIKNFAIHPGGKQILQKVEEVFGIGKSQNLPSHEILKNFGNMSSATILFVLKKWLTDPLPSGDLLAMGFGPGLTLETLLLEK